MQRGSCIKSSIVERRGRGLERRGQLTTRKANGFGTYRGREVASHASRSPNPPATGKAASGRAFRWLAAVLPADITPCRAFRGKFRPPLPAARIGPPEASCARAAAPSGTFGLLSRKAASCRALGRWNAGYDPCFRAPTSGEKPHVFAAFDTPPRAPQIPAV